jgi:Mce-associated membrane protein
MSKLSATVTSTPEEKWGLMADSVDVGTPDRSTAVPEKDTTEVAAPASKAKVEKTKAEPGKAESKTDESTTADKVTLKKEHPGAKSEEEVDTDRADSAVAEKPRSWWRTKTIRRIAVGVLVVIAVAAVVVAAILGLKLNEERNIDAAADDARAAAEQYAVTLTSVSSDNLDENFAAVLDGATGEFKDMYSQSSGQLRDLLVENQANAQGTVIDSGIKSATTSKVEVMLFVDQSVTNTSTPDARIDRSRVLMTMEKIDGRWLASKVDLP